MGVRWQGWETRAEVTARVQASDDGWKPRRWEVEDAGPIQNAFLRRGRKSDKTPSVLQRNKASPSWIICTAVTYHPAEAVPTSCSRDKPGCEL